MSFSKRMRSPKLQDGNELSQHLGNAVVLRPGLGNCHLYQKHGLLKTDLMRLLALIFAIGYFKIETT
jgi:hypothetical protein